MSFARLPIMAALAGALAACAVSEPLEVRSTGAQPLGLRDVALAPSDAPETGDRARFASALTAALARNGVRANPSAPTIAEFAIAIGAASDGIVAGDAASATSGPPAKTAAQPDWLAEPREARWLDGCTAQRLRATLALFDRTSGRLAYRGQASQTECEFTDADMAAMADALVRDAINRTAP